MGAITRAQKLLKRHRYAHVWRSDITKFFDTVDHSVLKERIQQRITDSSALTLLDKVINIYSSGLAGKGIPIGNLTSQIFTNIYLHELDRYVLHVIKPLGYVRYGDDFILISDDRSQLELCEEHLTVFIDQTLKVSLHTKNNMIVPVRRGIHFLGCDIFPTGRRLQKRVYNRIKMRMDYHNSSSYRKLILVHSKKNMLRWVDWKIISILDDIL